MRVLIGGLFHETNTFLEGLARMEDFEVLEGKELFHTIGQGSPLAGALEAAEQLGWTVLPGIDLRATPGPTVADDVVFRFQSSLIATIESIQPDRIDGVLLILHGAMVSESVDDVEGKLLHSLRELLGPAVPIAAVLDLHGNCTQLMAESANLLVAYRENPHIDAHETADRAARLLNVLLQEGVTSRCVLKQVPVVWPPTGTATAADPMRALERMAREIEQSDPDVLVVNVLAGFAFSDVRDTGVSFCCATRGSLSQAGRHLERLADYAIQHASSGNQTERSLETVLDSLDLNSSGPYLLIEPADNVGAGTSGRGLGVLKGLLRHRIANAAVVIQGPEHVAAVAGLAVGEQVAIRLVDPFDAEPLDLEVTLLSKSDGRFQLEDPQSHLASMSGRSIDMGPCAVVESQGIRILLTSKRTPPFDLGQLRSQGIEPESLFAVGIKAAVAHKRAWDPVAMESYWVDSPGPCSSNLPRLPYRKLRRPIFPLDPDF